MAGGPPVSPVVYENRNALGDVVCRFLVNFNTTTLALTSITAWNAQGSGFTRISLERNTDGTVQTFPLPTSGQRVTATADDGSTFQAFTATVTQAQINANGFTVLADIGTRTIT